MWYLPPVFLGQRQWYLSTVSLGRGSIHTISMRMTSYLPHSFHEARCYLLTLSMGFRWYLTTVYIGQKWFYPQFPLGSGGIYPQQGTAQYCRHTYIRVDQPTKLHIPAQLHILLYGALIKYNNLSKLNRQFWLKIPYFLLALLQ